MVSSVKESKGLVIVVTGVRKTERAREEFRTIVPEAISRLYAGFSLHKWHLTHEIYRGKQLMANANGHAITFLYYYYSRLEQSIYVASELEKSLPRSFFERRSFFSLTLTPLPLHHTSNEFLETTSYFNPQQRIET